MVDFLFVTDPIVPLLEDESIREALADGLESEVKIEIVDYPGRFTEMGEVKVFVLCEVVDSKENLVAIEEGRRVLEVLLSVNRGFAQVRLILDWCFISKEANQRVIIVPLPDPLKIIILRHKPKPQVEPILSCKHVSLPNTLIIITC
jgi:hypothetical protein